MKLFWLTNKKKDQTIYDNIQKIPTGRGDDYTTVYLLDCCFFKERYKLTAIDLSKQQKFDVDPKAMQQINFTAILENEDTQMFCIIEETKETVLDFWKEIVSVL